MINPNVINKEEVLRQMSGRWPEIYMRYTELKPQGGELRGPCPLHNGKDLNFAVDPITGAWFCHSQCKRGGSAFDFVGEKENLGFPEALKRVASFVGLSIGGAAVAASRSKLIVAERSPTRIEMDYDYHDEAGSVVYQVLLRHQPDGRKYFSQRRPDGKGGYINDIKGIRRVLYRLPKVLSAVATDKPIWIVEGEKCADRLCKIGLFATCNSGGSSCKWDGEFEANVRGWLSGADVIILPDNDEVGRKHAQKFAQVLYAKATKVRVVNLPGLDEAEDVYDFIERGGNLDKLTELRDMESEWIPQAHETARKVVDRPNPGDDMFHGILGAIVKAHEPHTEADSVAVLVSLIVAIGNVIGRGPHYVVDSSQQYCNLNAIIVGPSSTGRKGTAWNVAKSVMAPMDVNWKQTRVVSGLSSGEGLIQQVSDLPVQGADSSGSTAAQDKRLLVVETEFARPLRVAKREGNILSTVIRQCWDSIDLQVMTKQQLRATEPHVSIIGHITPSEVVQDLNSIDVMNGFGNRFLWIWSQRTKLLPDGGCPDREELEPLSSRLAAAIYFAQRAGEMQRNEEARQIWHEVYPILTGDEAGAYAELLSRGAANVVRLSMIYALMDCSDIIRSEHMRAALSLWEYSRQSVAHVFNTQQADPLADKLSVMLKQAGGSGLTLAEISAALGHNVQAKYYRRCLDALSEQGKARVEQVKIGAAAKPTTRWYASEAG